MHALNSLLSRNRMFWFGLGQVFFPQSSWFGVVWICDQNNGGNSRMFRLLLSRADTQSKPFLPLAQPHQWVGWAAQGLGMDTAGTPDPSWPKGYSWPYGIMLSVQTKGEKQQCEGEDVQNDDICVPKLVISGGALLSWGWLNTCHQWKVVNEFLLCLCV